MRRREFLRTGAAAAGAALASRALGAQENRWNPCDMLSIGDSEGAGL
jgi:hypothetical protein